MALAGLIGEWCFFSATPTQERTGRWSALEPMDGARLSPAGLVLTGGGWARVRGYSGAALRQKTLVVWLRLDSLDEARPAGSAMTVDSQAGDPFDGIVFGEREDRTWMAGSEWFTRSQDLGAVATETRAGVLLRMAVTYAADGAGARVSLYRNEQLLGSYTRGALAQWQAGDVEVLFGARHTWRGGVHGRLEATVLGAQLYERALGRPEISTLVCPGSCLTFRDFGPEAQVDTTLPVGYDPYVDDWCSRDADGWRYWLERRDAVWSLNTDFGARRSYGTKGTQHARIEMNDRPARPAHPPAILLFNNDALKRLRLVLSTRNAATSRIEMAEAIDIATDSLLYPVHSGGGNSVLTLDEDLVLVAYPSTTAPAGGVGTNQFVAVVSRSAKTLLATHLVGCTGSGTTRDEHDIPAITADSTGRVHILLGGHHTELRHRSIARADLRSASWDAALSPLTTIGPPPGQAGWGHTYVALVCDAQDRLHVVTRWSGDRYRFQLVYNRREADGTWATQQCLVDPGRTMYVCWHHRLLLEGDRLILTSPGPIWGQVSAQELASYRRRWPDELPAAAPGYPANKETFDKMQRRHPGFTLVSEDGGWTWTSRVNAPSPVVTVLAGEYGGVDVQSKLQAAANDGHAGVWLASLGDASGATLTARFTVDGVERSVELVEPGYLTFFGPEPPASRVVVVESASYEATDARWSAEDVTVRVQQLASQGHAQFRVRDHILGRSTARNVPRRLTVTYALDGGASRTRTVAQHEWFVF
jgi:hypothetical protein